ncbi:DUF1513 domain-containing protein [Ruegeria arenilitoris]|uniref:DUF1513 domain-containing protein n=1 Tax=Ruegeria arenilitoris TaxID=1173585 RepID=UPI00147DEBDB|nr:DUF1513 domain-containing protein [Ruegeria arenilitoris]
MTTRRGFLAGLAAATLAPLPGWAEVGSPDFLSAALFDDGSYRLVGLTGSGEFRFSVPLPGRGHAAAAHPHLARAVAFARRPGRFALVIDCATGDQMTRLEAPAGRHFYGHGAFSPDGRRLFTTENDYEAGTGVIGVWDAAEGYARMGEFSSAGVGPHDVVLMPDGKSLAIANGGIETHPDTGRSKLNLPTMRPNLTYVSLDGSVLEQVELPAALHKNSIRHLAVRADGLLAFAMQWQGDLSHKPALLGLNRRGGRYHLLSAPDDIQATLAGYAGSVAFSAEGRQVAITCPRGNALHVFDAEAARFVSAHSLGDVCGLGPGPSGFVFTTGHGDVGHLVGSNPAVSPHPRVRWDNHLVPIRPAI